MTGRTPLMWAIESNNLNCVSLLLAAGASPFKTDKYNSQPFIDCTILETLKSAKKIWVVRKLIKFHKREFFSIVFPYKDQFRVDQFERQFKVDGYLSRNMNRKPNLKIQKRRFF